MLGNILGGPDGYTSAEESWLPSATLGSCSAVRQDAAAEGVSVGAFVASTGPPNARLGGVKRCGWTFSAGCPARRGRAPPPWRRCWLALFLRPPARTSHSRPGQGDRSGIPLIDARYRSAGQKTCFDASLQRGSVIAGGISAMATRRAFLKAAAFGTAYLFSSRAHAADLMSTIQSRMDDYCARTLADSGANVAIVHGPRGAGDRRRRRADDLRRRLRPHQSLRRAPAVGRAHALRDRLDLQGLQPGHLLHAAWPLFRHAGQPYA